MGEVGTSHAARTAFSLAFQSQRTENKRILFNRTRDLVFSSEAASHKAIAVGDFLQRTIIFLFRGKIPLCPAAHRLTLLQPIEVHVWWLR